ncbi:hypothetical protein DFQ06_3581 [Algibacter lectus]|uniref:Uncharacterized protein n=1 Tax=Algibacter lectus TaxID=221126 RepID=A0A4R8M8V4_9FLAO|nr:hypothetical protein DFQ06_3581 [Algibacter lectus]
MTFITYGKGVIPKGKINALSIQPFILILPNTGVQISFLN